MLDLSTVAKSVKNKLDDGGVWLVLLSVKNKDLTVQFDIVANTNDVTWNGKEFTAFPFSMDEVQESTKGSLPSFQLSVCNVERVVQSYIEGDVSHGSGWDVDLMVVHSSNLANNNPEVIYSFKTLSVTADENNVVFTVGMQNPLRQQFPRRRMMTNFCQNTFKARGCTYAGADTICGKTISDCRLKFPNSDRLPILVFSGIPTGSIYA